MFISKLKGKPIIFTPHSATIREQKKVLTMLVKKTFDCTWGRYLIRSPNILIALTQDNIKDYLKLGAEANKIRLIPNGIDMGRFRQLPDPLKFMKKYGITGEVVLFVGRLVKYKGIHYLLQIAPKILEKFPETKFIIVGPDYGYKNELLKLVKTLGLRKSVVFTGAISDNELLEAYTAADVLAFPSIHEGFGLVLLEAMACRKPIVTWKTSAMQYILEDRKSGILVNPWNLEDFAESIISLLSNKKLAKDMGEKGRRTVEEKFEWEPVIDMLEATYREATAK
jgi:glycosyltransferase involved in cell wall biosynthesis